MLGHDKFLREITHPRIGLLERQIRLILLVVPIEPVLFLFQLRLRMMQISIRSIRGQMEAVLKVFIDLPAKTTVIIRLQRFPGLFSHFNWKRRECKCVSLTPETTSALTQTEVSHATELRFANDSIGFG